MNDTSPHSSINDNSAKSLSHSKPYTFWFLTGLMIGAAHPVLLAGYFIHQFSAYQATLPPDTAVCGTPLLLPICLVLFVAPITGLLGGGVALLLVVVTQKTG